MTDYDYKKGKERVLELLNQPEENVKSENVPNDKEFKFDNGYYCYITGIFVDIRNSTKLFKENKKSTVSRIIRSFTSEIIEILRQSDNVREIGIRGDCVYGVYSTPYQSDIREVVSMAAYVNSFMEMLNTLLKQKNLKPIEVGIGIGTSEDLVVKAGRDGVGINSKVWIGKAVTDASNLSSYGNKQGYTSDPIVISNVTYDNIINLYVKEKGEKARGWFTRRQFDGNNMYSASLIITEFSDWIKGGMK